MNEIANIAQVSAGRLPELLSRAGTRLLEARTSAEVLEAKQLAEAALHYARVTKAANETHADCLRIITRAEMRMADEVDRGQASGDVAGQSSHGRTRNSVRSADTDLPTSYSDLGIDRRRVSEWRELRDAGPEAVDQAINTALAEERTPTKSEIFKHIRSDNPQTVKAVEEILQKERPEGFRAATHVLGTVEDYAEFCSQNDPATVAKAVMDHELDGVRGHIAQIDAWHARFLEHLKV